MTKRERVTHFDQPLDERSVMRVRITVRDNALLNYAVVLMHQPVGEPWRAVRLYDYTHGVHDEHRYDREGNKGPARTFHHGGIRDGFDEARRLIRAEYVTMISAWRESPHT